jgi:hypothetical protein
VVEQCNCSKYPDLTLDIETINVRVSQYEKMKSELKQIGQKIIDRWLEHYRLYKCEYCGQYWQSSISPGWGDSWYLFKVPKTTLKAWRSKPYISPDLIVSYIKLKNDFLSKSFELRNEKCIESQCNEHAISGLNKCLYHQFLQIDGKEKLDILLSKEWFMPYSIDQLNH